MTACFAWNWRRAPHGSGDLGQRAGGDGGPTSLGIGDQWLWSTMDGAQTPRASWFATLISAVTTFQHAVTTVRIAKLF
jgi:hypothetical protein